MDPPKNTFSVFLFFWVFLDFSKSYILSRKFYARRNNSKGYSTKIGAYLLPWSDQKNCLCTVFFKLLPIKLYRRSLIKRHRVTTNGNEWQRMTMSGTTNANERQQITMSGKANDNEWYSKWQRMTTSDNEWQQWQRVTKNDNEWQWMTASDKTDEYK